MHIETLTITLRNILLLQLLTALTIASKAPLIHRELLRIWRWFKTPLLLLKSHKTNHRSHKFWEIDMTKFEP
jgi:hypothetical protein